ncbi:MAG: hypothetical protein ABIO67_06575, partial [Mycobacteriales bacterium]
LYGALTYVEDAMTEPDYTEILTPAAAPEADFSELPDNDPETDDVDPDSQGGVHQDEDEA